MKALKSRVGREHEFDSATEQWRKLMAPESTYGFAVRLGPFVPAESCKIREVLALLCPTLLDTLNHHDVEELTLLLVDGKCPQSENTTHNGRADQQIAHGEVMLTTPSHYPCKKPHSSGKSENLKTRSATLLSERYKLSIRDKGHAAIVHVLVWVGGKRRRIRVLDYGDCEFLVYLARASNDVGYLTHKNVCLVCAPEDERKRLDELKLTERQWAEMAYTHIERLRKRLVRLNIDPDQLFGRAIGKNNGKGYRIKCEVIGLETVQFFSREDPYKGRRYPKGGKQPSSRYDF